MSEATSISAGEVFRTAILKTPYAWPRGGGRRPHRSSTEVDTEHRQSRALVINAGQLGWLKGQLQRALPLTASARLCNPS